MKTSGRLVILSGPSCIGKSPLVKALAQFYPELAERLQGLVLYNSRSPRPGEKDGRDYYFRRREDIEKLREDADFLVLDVRGDLQALKLSELADLLEKGDVLFEGNPFVGELLLGHPKLESIDKLSAFLSPLSREEIVFLKGETGVNLESLVTDVMRRKLLRRMQKQKAILSLKDLEEVERRAGSAYREIKMAHRFARVLVNHDGEDSDNWSAFYYPLGDARRMLLSLAALLRGEEPEGAERWEQGLVGD